ncbi:hypothetical protein MKZ38_001882 [Zalerion maritima]|uniref:Uncharacterized protein n=1 Tax=Zalerion maritima TaxID=339359 RepID=A0AAD5WRM5_9PEZI|nr:hypothetical protein MKZ38_001882 [Zalerion maritima]
MAAVKLPLALKKNVRDNFTNKIEELEERLSADDCIGAPWKVAIEPTEIYPHAKEGSYGHTNLGLCLYSYVDDAISRLKSYRESSGAEAMEQLNEICSGHTLTMALDESKKFNYCGVVVEDDRNLKIVFSPGCLGVNIYDCLETSKLKDALNSAPPTEGAGVLSFIAKGSIREKWDPNIEPVVEKIRKILDWPEMEVDPNWEEVFTALKTAKDDGDKGVRDDFEEVLGYMHVQYFDGFAGQLEEQGFEDPDYREGIQAEVTAAKVVIRVIDKLKERTYNECEIEDGVLYLQTTPKNWGANTYDCAKGLEHKL